MNLRNGHSREILAFEGLTTVAIFLPPYLVVQTSQNQPVLKEESHPHSSPRKPSPTLGYRPHGPRKIDSFDLPGYAGPSAVDGGLIGKGKIVG